MPRRKRRTKPKFRRMKNEAKLGMTISFLAISMVIVVVGVNSYSLKEKQAKYMARELELQQQIDAEKERAEELEEFATYTKTKKYVEEVAKDKLGLVYDNEIIFRDNN